MTLIVLQTIAFLMGGVFQLMLAFASYRRQQKVWKTAALIASACFFFAMASFKLWSLT